MDCKHNWYSGVCLKCGIGPVEMQAEIARLTAEVERLRGVLRKECNLGLETLERAEKADAERDAALKEQDRLDKAWKAKHEQQVRSSKDHAEYFDKSQRRMHELTAERDAIAAAAVEAAAKTLEHAATNWDCGHNESRLCDCARDAEQWSFAADEVRTITPSDARAKLNRMLAEARMSGWNEAKDAAAMGAYLHGWNEPEEIQALILALKPTEASHE
jgi:hypothetical protein